MQIAKISSQMNRTNNYQQKNSNKQPSFGVKIITPGDFVQDAVKAGVQDKIFETLEKISQRFKGVDYEFEARGRTPDEVSKYANEVLEPIEDLQITLKNVENHNKEHGSVLEIPEEVKEKLPLNANYSKWHKSNPGIFKQMEAPLKKLIDLLSFENKNRILSQKSKYKACLVSNENGCFVDIRRESSKEYAKMKLFGHETSPSRYFKVTEKGYTAVFTDGPNHFYDIDSEFQKVKGCFDRIEAKSLKEAEEKIRIPSETKSFTDKINSLNNSSI